MATATHANPRLITDRITEVNKAHLTYELDLAGLPVEKFGDLIAAELGGSVFLLLARYMFEHDPDHNYVMPDECLTREEVISHLIPAAVYFAPRTPFPVWSHEWSFQLGRALEAKYIELWSDGLPIRPEVW